MSKPIEQRPDPIAQHAKASEKLNKQGQQANLEQNLTHQGHQQDR
jgi:hypothetical protein